MIFTIFDFYSASGVVLLVVASCQCIAVGWSYGGWQFYNEITGIMGYVPKYGKFNFGRFMPFAWMFTAPMISFITLIFYFYQFPKMTYTFESRPNDASYVFPWWTQLWGLTMSAIPGVLIAGHFLYYYMK